MLVVGVAEINSRTIPRVHRSFSDFFTSTGAEDFRADTIDSDGELAIQSIRQLTRLWADVQAGLEISAPLPYAILHWPSHLTRVVGVTLLEETVRDDESVSLPDAVDIDPDTNSGAQIGVKAKENRRDFVFCITFSPGRNTHGDCLRVAMGLFGCEIPTRAMKLLCWGPHVT